MKKIILIPIFLLLILPFMVYAKTPNKEETLKVIEKIENIQVDDNIVIKNISIGTDKFTMTIDNNGEFIQKEIEYLFKDNELEFTVGNIELENINDNRYAFYLYSILENKSAAPYDVDSYYNINNIKEKLEKQKAYQTTYIDNSKTFGITIFKKNNIINIKYHYYFDGDYPIMEREIITDEELTNPNTRNYSVWISIMLVTVVIIGVYTYHDALKKKVKE